MPVPLNIIMNEYAGVEATPEECPKPETERIGNGQGMHIGLRRPWYNDMSHEITDNTLFRLLLICIAVEWILKKLDVI